MRRSDVDAWASVVGVADGDGNDHEGHNTSGACRGRRVNNNHNSSNGAIGNGGEGNASVVDEVVEQYMSLVGEKDAAIARLAAHLYAANSALEAETARRETAEAAIAAEQQAIRRIRAVVKTDREAAEAVKRQLASAHGILANVQVSLVEALIHARPQPTVGSAVINGSRPPSSRGTRSKDTSSSSIGAINTSSSASAQHRTSTDKDAVVMQLRQETAEGSAVRAAAVLNWQAARIAELEAYVVSSSILRPEFLGRRAVEAAWIDGFVAIAVQAESAARAEIRRQATCGAWILAVSTFVPGRRAGRPLAADHGGLGGDDDDNDDGDMLREEFAAWSMAAAVGRTLALSHTVINQRNIARSDAAAADRAHQRTLESAADLLASRGDALLLCLRRQKAEALATSEEAFNTADTSAELSAAQLRNRRLQEQLADIGPKLSQARASSQRRGSSLDVSVANSTVAPSSAAAAASFSDPSSPSAAAANEAAAVADAHAKRDRERRRRKELEGEVQRLEARLARIVGRAEEMNAGWAEAERRAAVAEAQLAVHQQHLHQLQQQQQPQQQQQSAGTPLTAARLAARDGGGGGGGSRDASTVVENPDDDAAMLELAEQVRAMRTEVRAALDSSNPNSHPDGELA